MYVDRLTVNLWFVYYRLVIVTWLYNTAQLSEVGPVLKRWLKSEMLHQVYDANFKSSLFMSVFIVLLNLGRGEIKSVKTRTAGPTDVRAAAYHSSYRLHETTPSAIRAAASGKIGESFEELCGNRNCHTTSSWVPFQPKILLALLSIGVYILQNLQ